MNLLKHFFVLVLIGLSNVTIAQDQMFEVCPLKIGEEVPKEVSLVSADGDSLTLGDALSKKTVLVFYRGGWCPYCIRHLSALHQIKDDIKDLGYDLIAVTPDQFDSLGVSEAKAEIDFTIYSDNNAEAIEAFGLGWRMDDELFEKYVKKYDLNINEWSGNDHRVLPAPAVYIIEEGVVQFQYVNPNYSVRMKPEMLKAVLETM